MTNEQQEVNIKERLEVLSKFTALIVLAVSFLGFLITSLHNANFGFSDINPLKAKIVSAGTVCALLIIFPIFVTRIALFTYKRNFAHLDSVSGKAVFGLFLYFACVLASFTASPLFQLSPEHQFGMGRLLLIAVPTISIVELLSKKYNTAAAAFGIVVLLGLLGFSVVQIIRLRQFTYHALILWMVGLALVGVTEYAKLPKIGLDFDWISKASLSLLVIFLFAGVYYPHIRASYGGGESLPVVVYFSKESAFVPNQQLKAKLVEESDNGYYIVLPNDERAVFVPRSGVSLVYFSEKGAPSIPIPSKSNDAKPSPEPPIANADNAAAPKKGN